MKRSWGFLSVYLMGVGALAILGIALAVSS